MKSYITGKDDKGNTVVYYQKDELKSPIAVIPGWWSNKEAIAMYIANSMNTNIKLVLEPKL